MIYLTTSEDLNVARETCRNMYNNDQSGRALYLEEANLNEVRAVKNLIKTSREEWSIYIYSSTLSKEDFKGFYVQHIEINAAWNVEA